MNSDRNIHQDHIDEQQEKKRAKQLGVTEHRGMMLGICLGCGLGAALEGMQILGRSVGLGLCVGLGMCLGLLYDHVMESKEKKSDKNEE